jgi:hypothetical protein
MNLLTEAIANTDDADLLILACVETRPRPAAARHRKRSCIPHRRRAGG